MCLNPIVNMENLLLTIVRPQYIITDVFNRQGGNLHSSVIIYQKQMGVADIINIKEILPATCCHFTYSSFQDK